MPASVVVAAAIECIRQLPTPLPCDVLLDGPCALQMQQWLRSNKGSKNMPILEILNIVVERVLPYDL